MAHHRGETDDKRFQRTIRYAEQSPALGRGTAYRLHGVNAFGLQIFAEGEELGWAATLGSVHSPLAWALTVLIIGHIGMALLHHFRGKDVLERMV